MTAALTKPEYGQKCPSALDHITTMPQPNRVAFIIAGGPRIGLSVATAFHRANYTVVVGCRNPTNNPSTPRLEALGIRSITVDVTSASSIMIAFEKIRDDAKFGVLGIPSVVIYNAAALTMAGLESNKDGSEEEGLGIFGMDVWKFEADFNVNLLGAYTAMNETVKGWKDLDILETQAQAEAMENDEGVEMELATVPRAFIATGNVVPWQPVTAAMTLGSGKAALAHLIQCGSMSDEYKRKGWRFYFVSQVTGEGGPVAYDKVDGEAHGREYVRIVEGGEGMWDVRFVAEET